MTPTRRTFLKAAATSFAGSVLFDVRRLDAGPPVIRKDVGGLSAKSQTLISYGNAITAMKALPTANPLSWAYQAAIHGTTLPGSPQPAWKTCEHGSLEFLSWHRMYLYWFERIIRKQSGDPGFALPFWNYELASERTLPAPFRASGTGLFVPDVNRGAGWNAGTAFLQASAVSTAGCLPLVPFASFSGNLEGTPHAAVHSTFGSTGGWMGSVPTAAQDPIFYLHHCNIDRLWNVWLAQGGSRSNPLNDTTWTTKKFLFFDENGQQVWMTGCDILRAQEQLGYEYEGEPPQVKQYCRHVVGPWWTWLRELLLTAPLIKLPPGPDPAPFEIDIASVRDRLRRVAEDKNAQVVLRLSGVSADRQPTVYWEAYAGLASGERATPDSKAYVGNIALFGGGVDSHPHGTASTTEFELVLDVALGAWLAHNEKSLPIRFVPVGAGGKDVRTVKNEATVQVKEAGLFIRRPQSVGK